MLDHETRIAILKLHGEGHGSRAIGKALNISRGAARRVLESGQAEVPDLERADALAPELDAIRALHEACEGNRVRVHEELVARGVRTSYTGLTAFCRRHGIGQVQPVPAGRYHFGPGKEMQHDTSPHDILVGGQKRRYQCASLVLCYSRMIY